MNPPQFPSGFLANLHWGRMDFQAIDCDSQWIEVAERVLPSVSNQVPSDSQQFKMAQQSICFYSHWGSCWFAFWDNTLTSLWISFRRYQGCGKGYPSCFNPGPNWFLTMQDVTAMNLPLLSSGFLLILHWARTHPQAFQSLSQEFGAV